MSQLRTTAKIYTYIPYESDESFDKVESSNSRSRTAPGTILPEKQLTESEWNSIAFLNANCSAQNAHSRKPKSVLPLDSPGFWQSHCEVCAGKLCQIGVVVGARMNRDNEVKRIVPLGVSEDDSVEYAVEYQNLRFEKFASRTLQKWYLEEMVSSLESAVFPE